MNKFFSGLVVACAASAVFAQSPCFDSNFGTAIGGGDDVVLPIQSIGFAFPFAGATYTDVHVSTNGLIYLSNAGTPAPGGTGCCAGTTANLVAGGPVICPFWSDLNVIVANGASVYVGTNGAVCTITWNKVVEYGAATPVQFDLQCQLWINGDIKFSYGPGLTITTAGDALVGASPGGGATVPASTDWSTAGAAGDTCFELFNNTGLALDLAGNSLFLTANPPSGYNYVAVPIVGCAERSNYGTGCVSLAGTSFYENFTAGTFDLSNSAMTLVRTSSNYLAIPGTATFVVPSVNATRVAIGDDAEQVVALTAPMPVGSNGSTSTLAICSNGYVSVATGNGTAWTPVVATFLNMPQTVFGAWHDYNQTIAGSGQIVFEEISGIAYVTWNGVWDFLGTSAANANTFQLQFELATGNVHYVWQQMSNLGNGHLIGFSEGGVSADPGNRDISATLPSTFTAATFAVNPLALRADLAPVHGTTIQLISSAVPSGAPFGAIMLGLVNPNLDLTGLGMAGCTQYTDGLASLLFLPLGSSTVSTPFAVPANTAFTGVTILSQSLAYAPASGLTALGAIASNGVSLTLGQ